MKRSDLIYVAKELNDVLGLEPPIPTGDDTNPKEIKQGIKEAISLIDVEQDVFTDKTWGILELFGLKRKVNEDDILDDEINKILLEEGFGEDSVSEESKEDEKIKKVEDFDFNVGIKTIKKRRKDKNAEIEKLRKEQEKLKKQQKILKELIIQERRKRKTHHKLVYSRAQSIADAMAQCEELDATKIIRLSDELYKKRTKSRKTNYAQASAQYYKILSIFKVFGIPVEFFLKGGLENEGE